jgi:chromosome segregation ATPase
VAAFAEVARVAAALAEELSRFENLADRLDRLELESQKDLSRAAESIAEASEYQKNIGSYMVALSEALTGARAQHETAVDRVLRRREQIEARGAEVRALLERLEAIGQQAREITVEAQAAGLAKGVPATAPERAETTRRLEAVDERLGATVEAARELTANAREAKARDVAEQADAMRQQLQAVRGKLKLLREGLASGAGAVTVNFSTRN